ncbi:MAG: PEGA domain-containing protein [Myxococcales bacterium]|nr:PEGA domain-containing protein [Myxococcales bacterium]
MPRTRCQRCGASIDPRRVHRCRRDESPWSEAEQTILQPASDTIADQAPEDSGATLAPADTLDESLEPEPDADGEAPVAREAGPRDTLDAPLSEDPEEIPSETVLFRDTGEGSPPRQLSTHPPMLGRIRIVTVVGRASAPVEVEVDDLRRGRSPLSLVLIAGVHQLRLERPGHPPVERVFSVEEGGAPAVLQIDLGPAARR